MNIGLKTFLKYSGNHPLYDAEVEYLQSTSTTGGGQWIDTGIIPTTRDIYNLSIRLNGTVSGHHQILYSNVGEWNANPNYWLNIKPTQTNTIETWTFGSPAASVANSNAYNRQILLTINLPEKYVSIKSYSYNVDRYSVNVGNVHPNQPTVKLGGSRPCLYYGYRVERDGVLIQDLIPVRKGNVGYMYDRVSGKLFGNKGTGNFTLGPDIVPVEYLESTGTQYLITLAQAKYTTPLHVKAKVNLLNVNGTKMGFASANGQNRAYIIATAITGGVGVWNFGLNTNNFVGICESNTDYNIEAHVENGNSWFAVDGNRLITLTNTLYANSVTLSMFGRHNGSTFDIMTPLRIYNLSWEGTSISNDIMKQDIIPVRIGNEGAMIDKITRWIFRRYGTDNFIVGPDKNK